MEERERMYQLQSQTLSTMREYRTNLFCKLQQIVEALPSKPV